MSEVLKTDDNLDRYISRVDTFESLEELASEALMQYGLDDKMIGVKIIAVGYEDLNVVIETEKQKLLMKIFSNERDDEEAQNCVARTSVAAENGLPTPRVHESLNGERMTIVQHGDSRFRLTLLDFIEGQDFYGLGVKPDDAELSEIVDIATRLSSIDLQPTFVYDSWAINNFCLEFEKKRDKLPPDILLQITPTYERMKTFDYKTLPKSFTHGDMRSTNLMRDVDGKIWLIDFSVSNYMARLTEITVICSDVAMIAGDREESLRRVQRSFHDWCEKVSATDLEKQAFPLFFEVANAINIMNTMSGILDGDDSAETQMHLAAGEFGLSLSDELSHTISS